MNRLICFLSALLFLASCASRRETVAPMPPVAVAKPPVDTVVTPKPVEKKEERKVFNLSLVLSLNAERYLETDSVGNSVYPELEPQNLSALHLYEGILLASMSGDSSVHISVTDAGTDSLRVARLLKDKKQKNNDLVVTQLVPSLNATAALASAETGYPLMILQHNNSNPLYGNKNTWLATPSNKTQCRQIVSYMQLTQSNAVFRIIYRDGNKKEADLAELFYSELIGLGVDSTKCKKINYGNDGWAQVQKNWSVGKHNVLFIPISDEALLSALFKKLETKEQSEVLIVGLPTWEYFETIDFSVLENLNTHIFSASYIDYENEKVKEFRKRFIEEYHTDPLPSAFAGYDIYNWIASNYSKHGNKISDFQSSASLLSPSSGFLFKKICDNCGMENVYISILKFQDRTLVKVNK
jgi:hypothetical protein